MSAEIAKNYLDVLKSLKEKIRQKRLQASIQVNTQLLELYWEIGHIILQQQEQEGWGAKVIDHLSKDLKADFPDIKGFSVRNIKYMRAFAEAYPNLSFVQGPLAQISWYHHITLLDKLKDADERIFYMQKTIENGWSRNVMVLQIESKLYERQGSAITNFNKTLVAPQSDLAQETLKSPYVFDFLTISERMQERDLENALIANIKRFLLELGKGFAYVGNQYNLNVEGDDFFLDLLFYNTHLHCYVVFELKIGDFKPEYIGKLNFYINTVDAKIKTADDKSTIGVLLCKTPNKAVIKYALHGLTKPLGVADYELNKSLPEQLKADLPTEEELAQEIEKEIEFPVSPLEQKINALKERISKMGRHQIKEERNAQVIREIVDQVFYPFHDQFIKKNREVAALFKKQQVHFFVSSTGFQDKERFEEELSKNPLPYELKINYSFRGFINAGTQAFDIWIEVYLILDEYKYSISLDGRDNVIIEKLYHQLPVKEEFNQLAEIMLEKVLDDIENQLKRIGL